MLKAADFTEEGFVFSPFRSIEENVLLQADERICISSFKGDMPSQEGRGRIEIVEQSSLKDAYIKLIDSTIDRIKLGDFQKVVLSRSFSVENNKLPLTLLKKTLERYTNAFCYLWYHPKVGLWLGATPPEILLNEENSTITTMSLAGTALFNENSPTIWGDKELKEQQMVTDYIVNALGSEAANLNVGSLETVRAGNLVHLRTKITARLTNKGLKNILEKLHPTPAVCGVPSKKVKEYLLQNEESTRAFYTGFIGELNLQSEKQRSGRRANQENQAYRAIKKRTRLFVNLRCMQLKDQRAIIYVGGGITADSIALREWEETVAKSKTMLNIL